MRHSKLFIDIITFSWLKFKKKILEVAVIHYTKCFKERVLHLFIILMLFVAPLSLISWSVDKQGDLRWSFRFLWQRDLQHRPTLLFNVAHKLSFK